MQPGGTRPYVGGYPDEFVEEFGAEDGDAALHNPAVWGENGDRLHSSDVFNAGHGTATSLVGDVMRDDYQTVVTDIEHKVPQFGTAADEATTASDENTSAKMRKLALAAKLSKLGLPIPDRYAEWRAYGILLALFIGDWALIAVGFQVLGLSDEPWIPGLTMTDDLHLAALASVMTLVVLAHVTGVKLRRIEHQLDRRRTTVDELERAKLPRASRFESVVAIVLYLVASTAVMAIGLIRIDYLLTAGVSVNAVPFAIIQIAVLTAAVVVAFVFAHPYAKEWKATEATEAKAAKKEESKIAVLDQCTGSLNADIDLLGSIVARSGHHVGADESNVIRQGSLYARRATLAQPETTPEVIFPAQLPAPKHLEGDELLETLTGITPLPEFVKVTTDEFRAHHAANQAKVRAVAALLEKAELMEAFDEDALDELEIVRPVAPLVAVAKVDEEDAA
jgi:hypothetical protein